MGLFDGVGRIFVASLKLLVVPLVLVSLICGMAALGQSSRMGAIAGKTVGLYLITTGVAVSLGLTIATIVGLGKGMAQADGGEFVRKEAPPFIDTIVHMFLQPGIGNGRGQYAAGHCFCVTGWLCGRGRALMASASSVGFRIWKPW